MIPETDRSCQEISHDHPNPAHATHARTQTGLSRRTPHFLTVALCGEASFDQAEVL
jgi:hypothetical protein